LVPDVVDHQLAHGLRVGRLRGRKLPERKRRSGRRSDRPLRRQRLAPGRLERRRERPVGRNVTALATFGGQLIAGGSFTHGGGNPLASFAASFKPGAVPPGGTPTGTKTGTVLLNGTPFTGGPIPYGSKLDVTHGTLTLTTETGTVTVYGKGVFAAFLLVRGTDNGKPIVELRLTGGNFNACKRKLAGTSATMAPRK